MHNWDGLARLTDDLDANDKGNGSPAQWSNEEVAARLANLDLGSGFM